MKISVRFSKIAGVVFGFLLLGIVITACGSSDSSSSEQDIQTVKAGPVEGKVTISNWPLFIDPKTVKDFDREYGTETNYVEDINSEDEFFGKMQPLLAEGDAGGRTMFVMPDWMAEKMYKLGYLQHIDHAALPNVTKNLVSTMKDPEWDPGNKYSIPWQAGMTGLIVDKEKAPDIHSVNDLFDPKYKGKVSLLSGARDTLPLVLAADGIDPRTASQQDWLDAIDKVKEQVDSDQIRGFYGNNYVSEFARGNVVAGLGWSGDAAMAAKDNPNLEWRMPTEGCSTFTDSFVFPVGSPNPAAGLAFIDFSYRPKIAAQVAEFVQYWTPVKGIQEVFKKTNPDLADDPLMFPTEEFVSECFPETVLGAEDEEVVTKAYRKMMGT